jgi:hypothetical protein
VFDPTRFLGPIPEQDPSVCVWGFGRRVCAGRLFAETTAFLACATALATLKISKALDKDGIVVEPEVRHIGVNIMCVVLAISPKSRYLIVKFYHLADWGIFLVLLSRAHQSAVQCSALL